MRRREALAALGTALAGALAGCSGGGGEGAATATETATETATATATETATETATATATATPSVATASLGEPFAPGADESALRFTLREIRQAQSLGPTRTEEATDTFLVLIMTVENPSSSNTDVPADRMKLRAPGVIKNVDVRASEAVTEDNRFEVDGISQATVSPGGSLTGAVVFDAPTGNDYRVEISPDGDGRTYAVSVGDHGDAEAVGDGY